MNANAIAQLDWLRESPDPKHPYEFAQMQWQRFHNINEQVTAKLYSNSFLCAVIVKGLVGINEGYRYDGLTGWFDKPKLMRKAGFHDLGCQFQCNKTFREMIATRAMVDKWFLETDAEIKPIESRACYLAVRAYGAIMPPVEHTGLSVTLSLPSNQPHCTL